MLLAAFCERFLVGGFGRAVLYGRTVPLVTSWAQGMSPVAQGVLTPEPALRPAPNTPNRHPFRG